MRNIQKTGKSIPHVFNGRQMENRKITTRIFFQRHDRKSMLHSIVPGDEKWNYFQNLTQKKSWLNPRPTSTSASNSHRFRSKTMQCVVW